MKILYIHQHFSTISGATGTRSYANAKAMTERGHSVTMLCGKYSSSDAGLSGKFQYGVREVNIDGFLVCQLDCHYSNHLGPVQRCLIFFKFAIWSSFQALTKDYDVIYATSTPLTVGIPGIVAKVFRRKPFVFEVRDLWPQLPIAMGVVRSQIFQFILYKLEKITYLSADKIICLAPGIKTGVCSSGISEKKVEMVPNGCDFELFSKPNTDLKPIARKDRFRCIYAGTLGAANGLEAVIEVASLLQSIGDDRFEFWLVGDGGQKQLLQAQVQKRGIEQIFFHPPMPKPELAALFLQCDLGLQILKNVPEFYEGTSPNKFFDYVSAGLPVLINYPGWVARLIKLHKLGVCAAPNDPKQFMTALDQAYQSHLTKGRRERGTVSTAFQKEFSRRNLAFQCVEIVESILPGS